MRLTKWAAAALVVAATAPAQASAAGTHWVTTWGASTQPDSRRTLNNVTVRNIVHLSVGGPRIRLRITNAFGGYPAANGDAFPENTALNVGSVYVGRRSGSTAAVIPETQTPVTFGGNPTVRVSPGSDVVSDPVALPVTDGDNLAISVYVPGTSPNASFHSGAKQTSYMTPANGGNRAGQAEATGFTSNTTSWWWVDAVSVEAREQVGAVVALGDSITDSANATSNTNHRWPDYLANRLNATANKVGVRGVVNEGISGNSVLKDYNCCGGNPSGLSRLDRDVISHDGVSTVIVALGINDLGNYADDVSNVADITDGMRQVADKLHRAGLKVIWATLTPFEGTTLPGYYSLVKDAKRQQINAWIRSSPSFDGVVDFEKALADPANPLRMLPAYDSGDHLHPNDTGNQALANAVTWLDDPSLPISAPATEVGASVPATLSLLLGAPPSFGTLTPGIAREYTAALGATATSTAGDATLTVADPSATATGHLVNGTFALSEPLRANGAPLPTVLRTWSAPVANDQVPVTFTQAIGATEPLRTGSYSKTLVLTLSTTSP
jgi:lysophospholipase L1-like esterase